ncbi:MAG: CBS domain-containing protein [Deltaproteobacteria bacterium]|nr:CBS domain-containing protein [Deltaproteobacteria bacterium]
MSQSESFLKAFANLEKWLRRLTNSERAVHFYQIVDRAAERDAAARRYRDDLKEFADLRNAIVHERTDGHAIAEPNVRVVDDIQRLEALLTSPPKVVPLFQKKVFSAEDDWPLSRAVRLMETRIYSQLPVNRSNRFIALLTTNTISRWLGAKVGDDIVSISETTVAEVLNHAEDHENHVFFGRNASLFDALAKFDDFEERGKPLDAILITQSGKPTESLIGIITVYDVPKMLAALEPKTRRPRKPANG